MEVNGTSPGKKKIGIRLHGFEMNIDDKETDNDEEDNYPSFDCLPKAMPKTPSVHWKLTPPTLKSPFNGSKW